VLGDPDLARLLRAAGFASEPDSYPSPPERHVDRAGAVVIALGRAPSEAELARVVAGVSPGDVVAAALPGDPRAARRVVRQLRDAGMDAAQLAFTRRAPRPGLERARALLRGRRGGPIVVAGARSPVKSLVDEACSKAERSIGRELARRSGTVLSTGTVMIELTDPSGDVYLLRLAGGPAADLLERSKRTVSALLASQPARAVRERVLAPLAHGRAGPVTWTLEERIPGGRPKAMSSAVWDECLEFLVGLHEAEVPRPPADAPASWSLEHDFRALEPHTDERGRRTLERLEAELDWRLADVPRGWAHGDFWPANLLVYGGRLRAVVDWDSATAPAPPLLDLMHVLLLSNRRTRRLAHGARSLRVLWPLAQAGGDARMRRYCEATGTPRSASTLEGLALAYWVSRVGRDLRTYQNRPSRAAWMDANLHEPLRQLARFGD
jgi:aminoglycoside phosphotransferase (APT) family kinase protein